MRRMVITVAAATLGFKQSNVRMSYRFQYSLRTLFVIVAVIAVLTWTIGLNGLRTYHQHAAVKKLKQLNATIEYDRHSVGLTPVWLRDIIGPDLSGKVVMVSCRFHADEDADSLADLHDLVDLEIRNSIVTGHVAQQLTGLNKLEMITLYRVKVDQHAYQWLPTCPELRYLGVQETNIDDNLLQWLRRSSNLAYLELNSTSITDAGLVHIANLTNLKGLCLRSTRITDNGLKYITQNTELVRLDIADTRVTDGCVKHFAKLCKLEYVDISQTQISASADAELRQMLPNCHFVHFR